jgi:PKD repeat protein
VGHDEWNQARSAGNYGWPYFVANNLPYREFTFPSGPRGAYFDPAAPINNSPNNTGITNLPTARPAWIWTDRSGTTPEFPELPPGGGRCAMGGPVYHYNPALNSSRKLPAYYENTAFIYDWARDYIWEAKLDGAGDLLKINRFLPTFSFRRPHEMELGPDGALYMIEWGNGFGGNNADARVIRLDYVGGNRAPMVVASATPNSGGTPLTVQFSSAGTVDPEGDALSYAWSFQGAAATNSTSANPVFVYTNAGNYTARLTVRDAAGNVAVADVAVTVGNHRPVTEIVWPPNGSVFDWGGAFYFSGRAFDVEDGSTTNAAIGCSNLLWNVSIGHDDHAHGVAQTNECVGGLSAPGGHGNSGDNVFLVLRASYTDQGAPPVAALKGEAVHLLQPRRKEAEHHASQSGVSNSVTGDLDGNLDVTSIDHGDFISFSPLNLTNINSLTFRVAADMAGAQIEIRRDASAGPLVAVASVPNSSGNYTNATVPVSGQEGTHEYFLVFLRNPGDTELFHLNWLRFEGSGINLPGELAIAPSGTNLVISFTGGGALEYADGVDGPWQPVVPSVTSPYTITPEAVARFYRLRWP